MDNEQHDPDRKSASASQHQAQQEADKNEMIVDPLPSSESEKDSGSVTGAQGNVTSRGRDAVPATADHKPETLGTNGFVTDIFSPNITQSPEGKNNAAGQGLDGNSDKNSQSHRQEQIQKRQTRLTDGFMIKIPNHQHVGTQARTAHVPTQAPQPRKKRMQKATGYNRGKTRQDGHCPLEQGCNRSVYRMFTTATASHCPQDSACNSNTACTAPTNLVPSGAPRS